MSLLSGLTGAITGFIAGGPVGAIAGGVMGLKGGTTAVTKPSPLPTLTAGGIGGLLGGILGGGPQITMPFPVAGPGGVGLPGFQQPGSVAAGGGSCPRGYHPNRKALAASKHHGVMAPGSMCVRNRKINPLNARAITRSLRRVKRARKLVAKLHAFGGQRRLGSGGHRPGCGCFRCRKK